MIRSAGALLFTALCLWPTANASAQSADTVLFNGKILTVDQDFSVRQALAIGHGQVLASGTSAAMKKLAGNKARLIDLGGRASSCSTRIPFSKYSTCLSCDPRYTRGVSADPSDPA